MRCAVVGGAGFVGSHVVDALVKAGHDVVIMDKNEPRWHPSAMYRPLDITDRLSCLQAFQGFQVVFHLAAMANTQMAVNDPWLCTQLNCVGTVNVLDGCKNAGVERVVIAGSTLVSALQETDWDDTDYDGIGDHPIQGRYDVAEDSPIQPLNSDHPYVTSKLFEEMIARDYAAQYGLPVTILRYGIQYGPRMTPGVVVHSFIERALRGEDLTIHGDGEQWRQYLHVSDVAAAHVAVIERWNDSATTFNIVGPDKVSINDLAVAVQKVIPVGIQHLPARAGDTEMKMCSPQMAKNLLKWEATVGLDDGIASTIAWYRTHTSNGMRRPKK